MTADSEMRDILARQAATARLLPILTGGSVIPVGVFLAKRLQRELRTAAHR